MTGGRATHERFGGRLTLFVVLLAAIVLGVFLYYTDRILASLPSPLPVF
ncbi:hypothetical protein Hbl1158_13535 [Halobaculum sp. CBA1158]|nr:hypothetical protein [Halobaculum sp. CBA1158]UIO99530.1 hypothetical protein Hbl1158_13535 [Halobaculum sp. CBA1158]